MSRPERRYRPSRMPSRSIRPSSSEWQAGHTGTTTEPQDMGRGERNGALRLHSGDRSAVSSSPNGVTAEVYSPDGRYLFYGAATGLWSLRITRSSSTHYRAHPQTSSVVGGTLPYVTGTVTLNSTALSGGAVVSLSSDIPALLPDDAHGPRCRSSGISATFLSDAAPRCLCPSGHSKTTILLAGGQIYCGILIVLGSGLSTRGTGIQCS